MNRSIPLMAAVAAAVALLPAALRAQAQTPPTATVAATPASAASDAADPQVIVVRGAANTPSTEGTGSYAKGAASTATGLSLSLRDTPQAVSVVTRERIDDQAMSTVADALRNTIGLSVKPVDRGRNNVSARGFDVSNFLIDGVPVANGNVGIETVNTAIIDSLEIVRGATGLTSGAGDPSAAVNLVRKHANSREFTGTVSLDLGSWNERTGTLDLSTPLNADASVRGRFVASYNQQDAFIDLEHTKRSVVYGVIDADLDANTKLSFGASDQRDKRNGVLWAGLPYWYSDGTRTDFDRSATTATKWNQWDTTEQTLFASLEHRFDNRWVMRGYANYHRQDEDSKLLLMWGDPDPVTGEGMEAYPYHYISKPVQLDFGMTATGPFQAFGREHELTVGLLHSRLRSGWSNVDLASGEPSLPVGDITHWDGSFPEPEVTASYKASAGRTEQTAAYAAARLQLTDSLKLILGGRFTDWQHDEYVAVWTAEGYKIKEQAFTPYAGLVLELNDQVSAYASYADMFKPQPDYRDQSNHFLDPLRGKSYELGVKGEFMAGKLNASAAVFRTEQDNYAIPDGFIQGTSQPAYRTAQGVKAKGYELEVTGDLSPQWNLSAGWTQFSAKDPDGLDVAVDHARKQFKLFTKYELAGALQGVSVGGGVQWEGSRPATAVNPGTGETEKVGQPAYALVDLMARYQVSAPLSLQLNVTNAFDKTYRSGSYWWGSPFTYGEPRRVVASMDYKF